MHTIGVEKVPTPELHAGLSLKFACITDGAKLIAVG